jgi:hypothetical protein
MLREWDVPGVYLSWTCDIPGAAFAPVPALARRWSADRRLSRATRAWKAQGTSVACARARFLAGRPHWRPDGRQVPPLVFSAWDSATRNAAVAVVNSGGSTPPAPRAPCQMMSQVIVAVAVNAPPGCPALERV